LLAGRVQAQVYYLDLNGQQLLLPERQLQVEQVVDGRPGRPPIGLVHRGLNNRVAAVLFRHGLETELTAFLQQQLPVRPGDHAVVLCLRQLRVSEQIEKAMSEVASADLAADVYEHLPDGYHFVRSVAARTSARAMETTAQHAVHISRLLQNCLFQLTSSDWAHARLSAARSLAQLATDNPVAIQPTGKKQSLPAILRKAPRRGVYYNFEQFLANLPDTTLFVRADTISPRLPGVNARGLWQGVARIRAEITDSRGKRLSIDKMVWGFSDGQQMYVQQGKQYFPLARQGSFFTLIGEKPLDVGYQRARTEAYARTGVLGVATMSTSDHTGEPMPFALDMRTGQLAPFPDPLRPYPARADTASVYIYRQGDTSVEPVAIFLEGKEVGQLRPNEYLQVRWPYYARMMQLCMGLPVANTCQLLVPDAARPNYLKISVATTNGSPTWQWITSNQGEADLNALDKLHVAPSR
jgi:hypothetical protein